MSGRIGGNVADIGATANQMTAAGDAASTGATHSAQFAQTMQTEVEQVTATLNTGFTQMAGEVNDQITQAMSALESTDWEGQSYQQATAAANDLRGQTQTILNDALHGVDEFKASLTNQANSFLDSVRGQFRQVMTQVQQTFESHATAYQSWAEGLSELDNSLSRS